MRCAGRIFAVLLLAAFAAGTAAAQGPPAQAPMAGRRPGEVASLARLQPVGEVCLLRRAKAVPGGGFPADLATRLQLRASADGLPLLDQRRQLGGVRRDDAARKSTRRSRGAGSTESTFRINFHRAPGYTVASPPEKTSLWTDPKTQGVCAKHWAMFARRYRGIPSERLSFNLMNEPARSRPKAYVAVVRKLAEAIRARRPGSADHRRRPPVGHRCRAGAAPTPHRPGHARLHAHGNQPLQAQVGSAARISPIPSGRACCRPTAPC